MNVNPEIVGGVAATLTTISFVPQAVKVIQTKDTSGISLWMYIIFTLGISLWFVYGVMLGSYPIMISNIFTLGLAAIILTYKIREK